MILTKSFNKVSETCKVKLKFLLFSRENDLVIFASVTVP